MRHASLIFIISILFFSCQSTSIQQDLLQFDRAYIPVFIHVYDGDLAAAQQKSIFLYDEWQSTLPKYKKHYIDNEDASECLRRIEGHLLDAFQEIEEGNQIYALNQLDDARYELREWTRAHEVAYFMDDIWEFEAILDVTLETISDPLLCLMEWNEFLELVEDLETAWNVVQSKEMELEHLGFDPIQRSKIYQEYEGVTLAIEDFVEALECADSANIAIEMEGMVRAFYGYLGQFGAFETRLGELAKFNALPNEPLVKNDR